MLQLLDTKGIDIAVGDNALTKVPAELSKFTEYVRISLNNNKIESIPVGTFNKLGKNVRIDLMGNSLSSIPAGAFNFPLATDVEVILSRNPISSISPGFFQGTVHSKLSIK
jgi:hypothetical protein